MTLGKKKRKYFPVVLAQQEFPRNGDEAETEIVRTKLCPKPSEPPEIYKIHKFTKSE